MVGLALVHGAVLVAAPSALMIALGVWWSSNTIAHQFIHRPFFRRRAANQLFGAYLSVVLGIPQSLWRDRHLAHHAGLPSRLRFSHDLALQVCLVAALWVAMAVRSPRFFVTVYVPGYAAGLLLCWVHGHYEHVHGVTSHYGAIYNLLCFNDGYHAEHHARPARHWTELPDHRVPAAQTSNWPAPLRWMDGFSLTALERLVLRSPRLARFVVRTHERAIRELVGGLRDISRVGIVGGGLFPRTALILRDLLPRAHLTIIDASRANLDIARQRLSDSDVELVHARFDATDTCPYDLLVLPLSFEGDRASIYARPPAAAVIVHDWIWRARGVSRIVSVMLLKRVNLVVSVRG